MKEARSFGFRIRDLGMIVEKRGTVQIPCNMKLITLLLFALYIHKTGFLMIQLNIFFSFFK